MAEEFEKYKRFEYRMNSNLVLQREGPLPNQNEPTGESESLVGKIKYRMGDKVEYTKPKEMLKKKSSGVRGNEKRERNESYRRGEIMDDIGKSRRMKGRKGGRERSVLNINLHDIFLYKPTTKFTQEVHANILSQVRNILGDNTAEVINSACNEILHILKKEGDKKKDEDKKKEIEDVLGTIISDEQFIEFNTLAKGIYDFNVQENVEDYEGKEEEGVAVIFDAEGEHDLWKNHAEYLEEEEQEVSVSSEIESEIEDEEEEENNDVDDDNDDDDDEKEDHYEENEETSNQRINKKRKRDTKEKNGKCEPVHIKKKKTNKSEMSIRSKFEQGFEAKKKKDHSHYNLEAHVIDAHWLQRELNKIYNDSSLSFKMEKEILEALKTKDVQQCENKIVTILKYENFNTVKLLIKNRWKIYFCTLLGQAQSEKERNEIIERMKESTEGEKILEDLKNYKTAKKNKQGDFGKSGRNETDRLVRKKRFDEVDMDETSKNKKIIFDEDEKEKEEEEEDDETGEEEEKDEQEEEEEEDEHINEEEKSYKNKKENAKNSHRDVHSKLKFIDLEKMEEAKGVYGNAEFLNKEVMLPSGSQRIEKKDYDEIIISPLNDEEKSKDKNNQKKSNYYTKSDKIKLVAITELPLWVQEVFHCVNIHQLNAIQSKVFDTAFHKFEENLLICAPTGSGKTNIALLCILNVINQHRLKSGVIDKKNFKIVYISPMKALVTEQVQSFNLRLKCLNLKVSEMTGDTHLSGKEMDESQVIVMTPEKFEIISRKWNEKILLQKVKLIIFDEIHLLNESRGSVLESIITRLNRYMDKMLVPESNTGKENRSTQNNKIRLVGLSATLPNYEDVGLFLRADLQKGVFYFDPSFRPVQLVQHYIGIKEKKGIKKYNLMNELTYEQVLEEAGKNQILIFVHSRKETYRTAKTLIDRFMKSDNLSKFLIDKKISTEILLSEKEAIVNEELKEILPFGFGIHHAGLKKTDRKLVEDLFSDKHLQVLVSTSTLAWGINLPAHTVIIKGTTIYNINLADFDELSSMDVLQMVGRAGRPQFDKSGKAIIITDRKNLQLYLSLNNEQMCIESTLLRDIVNVLNAEIVLKNIQNLQDAIHWFEYTYLYIRMIKNPSLYGVEPMSSNEVTNREEEEEYDTLISTHYNSFLERIKKRARNIIYSAFVILEKYDLIKFDRKLNTVSSTYIGKISSSYYVDYKSIDLYNKKLHKYMNEIDLLKIFSMSEEFKNIFTREEEKVELSTLMEKLPIPIKESIDISYTKVNILFQLYLSNFQLNGYIINADMVYIQQNALRIFRAFFEISLRKGSYQLCMLTLKFCKMVERRMWTSMTPLRQFGILSNDLIKLIEKKNLGFKNYLSMNLNEYITIFKNKKIAKNIYKLVHHFPKIELSAYIQPLNHKMLKVELHVVPDFIYNVKYHGYSMLFWVFVFDIAQDNILHYDLFTLRKNIKGSTLFDSNKKEVLDADTLDEHLLTFFLPILDHPFYIVKVVSDKWLECESTITLSLNELILPSKNLQCTELLDLHPLPVSSLRFEEAQRFFESRGIQYFNPVHTQLFSSMYNNCGNAIVCNAVAKYSLIPSELCILRGVKCLQQLSSYVKKHLKNEQDLNKIVNDSKLSSSLYTSPLDLMKVVYIAPLEEIVLKTYRNWFSFKDAFGLKMCVLTGDATKDMKLLQTNHIILSTPENYDNIFKKWRRRKVLHNVNLYIFDRIELLNSPSGAVMELLISRVRYVTMQLQMDETKKEKDHTKKGVDKENYFNFDEDEEDEEEEEEEEEDKINEKVKKRNKKNEQSIQVVNKLQSVNINRINEHIGWNRILCLSSCSLYNCKDFSDWIGCKKNDYYNFLSTFRNIPIEIYLHAVNIMNKKNRYISMQRQVYQNIRKMKTKKNAIIFVTEQKMCKMLAIDLLLSAYNDNFHYFSSFESDDSLDLSRWEESTYDNERESTYAEKSEEAVGEENTSTVSRKGASVVSSSKGSSDKTHIIDINLCKWNKIDWDKGSLEEGSRNGKRKSTVSISSELFGHMHDKMLTEFIKKGICYLHNNMTEMEKRIVEMLFDKKAVQILIVCYDYLYHLNVHSNMIIILDTIITYYNGKEEDYSVQKVLEMIGHAGREGEDNKSFVYIYTYITKKEFYKNFIYEALTVESNLEDSLPNFLNNEIVMSTIENFQDAIDWITWTFFYRRIKRNPNYYGLKGVTNQHISDYLSELIESNVEILSLANCIYIEESKMDIKPYNLGIISSFYNIDYHTVHFFNQYILTQKTLRKSKIFELISLSSIFNTMVPLNVHDIYLCLKIVKMCNMEVTVEFLKWSLQYDDFLKNGIEFSEKVINEQKGEKERTIQLIHFISIPHYFSSNLKTLIMLQAHIHRYAIPVNYMEETKRILLKAFKLLNSLIDVISSNNILNFCLFVMEVSQMLTQSLNSTEESNLYQLPCFDKSMVEKAKALGVSDIYDLINCEEDQREELLKDLTEYQKSQIANVCNIFPIIEVNYQIDTTRIYKGNEVAEIILSIQRDVTEDPSPFVHAPYLPFEKEEMWWIVIGIKKMNLLLAIKKVSLLKETNEIKLNFTLPEKPQVYGFVIYVINDSYVGCDLEYEFHLTVEE